MVWQELPCLLTAFISCLYVAVTGKNAELKRLDGMSEKPGIISFTRIYAGCFGKTRFKQGMFKRSLWINLARLQPGVQSSAKRNLDAGTVAYAG